MKIEQMFHRPEHFTPPTNSQSPAEKASRKWDAREGEIIEQNYNLRRLLLGLVVVIVALAGALCYKAVTENTLVYVVETDIKTGEVRNVGTANSMANYTPNDEVYSYFIRQFVQDIRSVPLDEVVYNKQLNTAYSFLTKDGANILTSRMEAENRVEKLHRATVQVTAIRCVGQRWNIVPVPASVKLRHIQGSSQLRSSRQTTRRNLPSTLWESISRIFVGSGTPKRRPLRIRIHSKRLRRSRSKRRGE